MLSQHLTEQDIKDAKEILEIMESLDNDSRLMAKAYIGALRDVQIITEQPQKTA